MTVTFISLIYIKNSRGKSKQYIVILIKDSANGANRPIIRGSFSILKTS